MTHFLNLLLTRGAVVVLLWLPSFSGQAAEPDRISLAYCTDCVPFQFQDKDGRPAGMIIDFWRLWSERTGIGIDFQAAPWDRTLRMMTDGGADAHAGLFFSDARARFLEYGAPLTRTDTHFFVKKGLPPIETVDDLAGHRVGVLAGDFVEGFLKQRLPARDVVGFESYDGIMTALREGKLQIFAADTPTGIFHLQKSGLGFAYEFPADQPLYRNDWFVAAKKGNAELIRVIDAGMALITETERREIERRWVALGTKGFELTTRDIVILVALLGIAAALGVVIWIVTLRRRIELRTAELSESEERYALAMQGSNEGLWDWVVDGDVLRVSPRFKAISGLTTDSLEITPAQWLARMHPEDVERYRDNMRAHLRGGTDFFSGEFRLLGEQGDYRWVRASARGLRDETGRVYRMVGSIGDITERKQAEQEVRKVWDAIEELSEGFALYDSDDRLVKCNQRYREIFSGIAHKLVPGTSFEEILDAGGVGNVFSDEEGFEAWKRERIEEHHQPSEEGLLQRANDGSWILIKEHRTQDGGYLSIRTDVTELKRAEEALSDQLKFTEALVDTIPNPIFVKDPEGRYLNFNRAYIKAFGIRREDYIGKTVMEVDYLPLDLRKRLDREDGELFRTGGTMHTETVRKFSDGEQHDMLYWQTAFELSSGVIGGLVGVMVDISEQKRAEEALSDQLKFTEALVDTIPNPIFVKDPERRFLNFNRAFENAFGIRREDYVGKTVMDREHMPLDLQKRLYREEEEILRTGGTVHTETVREFSDGKQHDMLYWLTAFELSSGVVGGLVGVMVDISEQKSMERELGAARDAAETAKLALEEAYGIIKVRSDRMEDELNIAREIQMSMVPLIFPPFPVHDEFSLFATLEPAREVGGDFYDFYFIDEDRLCVCIGDVSGKGVPSALFMAVAKTLIKSRAGDDPSTASILTHVNDELSRDNKSHMFVTIFIAILNIATGEMIYTNAGHNPPYLKRADGALLRLDRRHGPVVAAVEGMAYQEDRDRMAPGDLLLLYTDGVTEARGPDDRMFSEGRLRDLLAAMATSDVERAVAETVAAVRAFEQETEQADDITVLALEFHGSPRDAPIAERRIVIKNRLTDIAVVNATFDAFAEEFTIPMPIATKFNLVFDELLSNVITYAYRDDAEHGIEINIERAKNRLTVTIADDGVPFNPLGAEIPDTSLSLEDRDTGGLGIHLVRNLVDEFSYQRRIDRNVVTLTSHIGPDGGGSGRSHRDPHD